MHRLCGIFGRHPSPSATGDIETALGGGHVVQLDSATASALATRRGARSSDAFYRDDDLILVADARLDAKAELCAALGDLAPAAGATDAALIAAAWRRWGRDCPLHLYGDYAFALFEARSGVIFAARDHVGARPFLYALIDGRLHFASDPATLLALPGVPDDPDEEFIATTLLHRRFEPLGRSFVRAMRRLEPGHRLAVARDALHLDRWWNPEAIAVDHAAGDAETIARYRALVDLAVADRIADATQVGVHLSGGIDSSLVAACAVPMLRARGLADPPAYSWHVVDPDADPNSEPGWSEAMRAPLGLELFAPELSPDEMAALLARDWVRGPDVRNLLHEAAIQRDAQARGVEVILSGWGGDEGASYNGRGYHPWLFATGRWRTLYRDRASPTVRSGLRTIYHAGRRLAREFVPEKPLRWRPRDGRSLIDAAFLRRTRPLYVPRVREFGVRHTQHYLLRYSSTTARLEDWAISGAERGIDYRFPLLDRRLLEFIYTLPPRMFRRGPVRRWLIRQAGVGLLPDIVRLNNSKKEPIRGAWIDKAMREALVQIADRLDAASAPPERARYVDMDAVRTQLAQVRRNGIGGQAGLRLAIQFLDIP